MIPLFIACKKEVKTSVEAQIIKIEDKKKDTLKPLTIKSMDEKYILFNGKVRRFFGLKDFKSYFGEIDSTQLMSVEEPCSYIFENEDGSKDMNDKYLYRNASKFENSGSKVAVDEFRFQNGNFLLFQGIKLDKNTTKKDFETLFKNAIINSGEMDVYNEGKLEVVELWEDDTHNSDGHLKVFFRNGKLFFIHWWFPC